MKLRASHEFALAAAARVSCCAALLGTACTPRGSAPAPAPGSDEQAAADAGASPTIVAEPDPYGGDPELDPSLNEAPMSEERAKLEQCQASVRAAKDKKGSLGPSESACCTLIGEHAYDGVDPNLSPELGEARFEADNEFWREFMGECCAVAEEYPAACSPWGPPMPPGARSVGLSPVAPRGRRRLDLRRPARLEARTRLSSLGQRSISAATRSMAVATWRGRMVNEHGSAPVFEGLVAQLEDLVARGHLDRDQLRRVRAFPAQERRHGVACGAVVEALGGEAAAEALEPREYPRHPSIQDPVEACLRNVLSICCLSETVAVALIAAEREDMPAGPLRELLTEIWADECGHANYGWRLLDTLLADAEPDLRGRLGDHLREAFEELERHELAHLPVFEHGVPPAEAARYGLCDGGEARSLFYATVERVIVPGLEARGIPAGAAWAGRRADVDSLRPAGPASAA